MEIDISEDYIDYSTDDRSSNTYSDDSEEEDFRKVTCWA